MSVAAPKGVTPLGAADAGSGAGRWWPLVVFIPAVLLLSVPTLASLHPRWVDFGYTHGYLILGLSLLLAIKACRREPLGPARPDMAGVGAFTAAMLLVVAGEAATLGLAAQMALPALWFGAAWAVAGWRNASRFFWPAAYLYFAIPVWDLINGSLQSLTVTVVSSWLRIADVPAFIDGNVIHIPAGSFEVAGGCSGLHYLVVGLALGAYLGLSRHDRWSSRISLFVLALATGLLANWIRVFSVIVAGHATAMQHFLIVRDHYYFGWALFLVLCLVPLVLLDRWLPEGPARPPAPGPHPVAPAAPRPEWRRSLAVLVALVLVSLLGLGLQARVLRAPDAAVLALPAPDPAGWTALGAWEDAATPVFHGPDLVIAQRFLRGEDRVDLYIAAYAGQSQGRELVYYANRPEGEGAGILRAGDMVYTRDPSAPVALRELEVQDEDGGRRLIWLARRVGGRWIRSDLEAKLWQTAGAVLGRHEARAVVVSTDCAADCAAAGARLAAFADAGGGSIFDPQ